MTTSSEYLDVAAALAARIAGEAIWHGARCNWVGAVPRGRGRSRAGLEALGPDLYNGTAGIALFLAEAALALGDARLRDVARGALAHAVRHADRVPGDGLYAGAPGIAYAAGRVAVALGCERAAGQAREAIDEWRPRPRDGAPDVVGGRAGTIVALLALADLLDDLLTRAVAAGDELIAAARRSSAGWCWPDPGQPASHGLCGLSHGAGGIGHALLELWGATGAVRFRDGATAAFDYERSWLQARGDTWPDLRHVDRSAARDVPAPASPTWCHGAPGIALSRLRAATMAGSAAPRDDADAATSGSAAPHAATSGSAAPRDDAHAATSGSAALRDDADAATSGSAALRDDADVALGLTRSIAAELSTASPDDFSLCHGAAGVADVLLYARDDSGLAERIGDVGMERHHATGSPFPGGLGAGRTPGLMVGLAGIGLLYLRLADRDIQTVLVVSPKSHATARRPA
jgi:lantibiotic modifying enzyme